MKILFGLLLASLAVGNLFRVQIYPTVALVPIDLIALCWLGYVMKDYKGIIARVKDDKIVARGVVFILFGTISLCINTLVNGYTAIQLATGLLYGLRFVAYLSILLVLKKAQDREKHTYRIWLLAVSYGILALGWLQYIFYPDLRNLYYLGWDEHYYRMFGLFFDPNFMGAFYVLVMWYIMMMKNILKNALRPLVYFAGMVLSIGAITLTYSRSTYLMLLVSAITYAVIQKKYKALIVGTLIFVAVFTVMPKQGLGEGVNLLRSASIAARITEYQSALKVINQSPIIGVGYNAYTTTRARNEPATQFSEHAAAGLPNSWLFVFATTGIAGFVLYLYWWKAIIFKIIGSQAAAYLLPATFGLWVHGLFENTLFYPFVLCFYLMLLVFGIPSQIKKRSRGSAA